MHSGRSSAPTAEALMRSRYSAFALGNAEYLAATWHPKTRPRSLELDGDQTWVRLDIVDAKAGGPFDTTGQVSFVAYYRLDGERHELRETSRFQKIDRRWYYLDAVALAVD